MDADLATLIAELEADEAELQLDRFDNEDAWELGQALVAHAREHSHAVTVDIRRHGHQLFHAALPGTAPENDDWIERKVRTVGHFNASSFLVARRAAAKNTDLLADAGLPARRHALAGGAFPIRLRGTGVVGTITVSGLAQADDHAMVVTVLRAWLGERSA